MGGFHQLRVRQNTIHKRYACLAFKTWFVDAGVISEGSADMALEGRHYCSNMRLIKESFNALIQHRVKSLTEDLTCVNNELLDNLQRLRDNPSLENVDLIISSNTFNDLYNRIFKTTGTQGQITVAYLKDVSSLLSLVRSVRDGNFKLHMETQREMLKFCFSFNHINYARYMTYQHLFLSQLEIENHQTVIDLKSRIGGSLSGSSFSSIYGEFSMDKQNDRLALID